MGTACNTDARFARNARELFNKYAFYLKRTNNARRFWLAGWSGVAWKSTIVAEVGPARIKVLRVDAQPYDAQVHDYNEALRVLDGRHASRGAVRQLRHARDHRVRHRLRYLSEQIN
ncbi:hypothetical protein [Burkholderia latens]|nr:hypothetical protein [Burkholderia latens]